MGWSLAQPNCRWQVTMLFLIRADESPVPAFFPMRTGRWISLPSGARARLWIVTRHYNFFAGWVAAVTGAAPPDAAADAAMAGASSRPDTFL